MVSTAAAGTQSTNNCNNRRTIVKTNKKAISASFDASHGVQSATENADKE